MLAAKINLGVCLDLLDTANTRLLGSWYAKFRSFMRQNGISYADCNMASRAFQVNPEAKQARRRL